MIKFLLKKFFKILIDDLSGTEKADFWFRFNTLMADVAEAAVRRNENTQPKVKIP